MNSTYQIQFHLVQRKIMQSHLNDLHNCDMIEIINIPTIDKAFELISSSWFKSDVIAVDNLVGIKMKIDEKFDNISSAKFKNLNFGKLLSIMITFESTVGKNRSKTFWKNSGIDRFYLLDDFDDSDGSLIEYCRKFILKELKFGKSGILKIYQQKTKIKLQELGNESDCNLLITAVQENNNEIAVKLLEYGFHVDCEDINGRTAVDFAWINYTDDNGEAESKKKANEIIMSLLKLNSKFPSKRVAFDYKKASKEVQNFIDMCEGAHQLFLERKYNELKEKIDAEPNLCHFYDRNNQGIAFERDNDGEIIKYLEESSPLYEDISNSENLEESPIAHLFILKSRSKVNFSEGQSQKQWKCIENAFKILNDTSSCLLILKTAATWKKLKIFFDFNQDVEFYREKFTSVVSKAHVLSNGTIYIGAKKLFDEKQKFEVICALIKELCHLAVLITYMNDTNPYSCSAHSSSMKKFEEKVVKECEKNQKCEEIIKNAFSGPKEILHSELIAAVVEIMIKYRTFTDGYSPENGEKLRKMQENQQKFKELFKYHEEVLEPRMMETLSVLKMLHDRGQVIKFENLTKSMKERVSHGKIILQGVETTFYELLGNDADILKLLTSSDLRDCLIKNKTIKISDMIKINTKTEIIRRKFVDIRVEMDEKCKEEDIEVNKSVKNYMQVKSEAENSRIFLLGDYCKKSRTATFEDLSVKLKESYRNCWVFYIKVKNYSEIFEDYAKNKNNLTIKDICDMFLLILNLNSEIEAKIFKKLFEINKIIFLFDSVDDISLEIFEFFIKTLIILKKDRKNQLWVAFQPQNSKRLGDIFKVNAYKTVITIYRKEKRKFIENVLKNLNYKNSAERFKIAQEILFLIDRMEADLSLLCTIEIPQIIEIITELFIRSKINSATSLCEIFEKVVDRKRRKIEKNFKFELAGAQLLKFHQVFALKSAFGRDYDEILGFKLEDLTITKDWEKEKHKYTAEKILRYEFLEVDPDNRNSFQFSHETYSHFFIIQFIYSNLFNSEKIDEFEKIFKVLTVVENEKKKFKIARVFLLNFMKNDARNGKFNLHQKVEKLVIKEALGILRENCLKLSLKSLEFWSTFFTDINFLIILWQVSDKNNMLKRFLTTDLLENSDDFKQFIGLLEYCFGTKWHERFNGSGKKLIFDDEIEIFEDNFDKNFLKLLNYVEENLKQAEEKFVYRKFFQLKVFKFIDVKILNKILPKICDIFEANKTELIEKLIKFVEFYAIKESNEDGLTYFGGKIQEIFNNNRESIRQVLFYEYRSELHPLIHAMRFENVENFKIYKNLYKTYKSSWNELQEICIAYSIMFKYTSFINDDVYPEFEKFFKEIFAEKKDRLKESIVGYFIIAKRVLVRKKFLTKMMDLMAFVFTKTEMKELKISSKFTTFNDFVL